jgi:hypothetical protein
LLSPFWLHSQEVEQARKYLGVCEKNNRNFSSKEFEAKLCSVGWREGRNWCAYFVSLVLNETNNRNVKIRSGLAQNFILRNSISAKRVLSGYQVKKDWLVIWKRGETIFGHIGFVEAQVKRDKIHTIEGNSDNCVREQYRYIRPLDYFRITHFTRTR